jgi:hypothetical protein
MEYRSDSTCQAYGVEGFESRKLPQFSLSFFWKYRQYIGYLKIRFYEDGSSKSQYNILIEFSVYMALVRYIFNAYLYIKSIKLHKLCVQNGLQQVHA